MEEHITTHPNSESAHHFRDLLAQKDAQLKQLRMECDQTREELTNKYVFAYNKIKNDATARIQNLETQIAALRQELEQANARLAESDKLAAEEREHHIAWASQAQAYRDEIAELESRHQQTVDRMKAEFHAAYDHQTQALHTAMEEAQNADTKLFQANNYIESLRNQLEQENLRYVDEITQCRAEITRLTNENKDLLLQVAAPSTSNPAVAALIQSALEHQQTEFAAKEQSLLDKLASSQADFQKLKNQHDTEIAQINAANTAARKMLEEKHVDEIARINAASTNSRKMLIEQLQKQESEIIQLKAQLQSAQQKGWWKK